MASQSLTACFRLPSHSSVRASRPQKTKPSSPAKPWRSQSAALPSTCRSQTTQQATLSRPKPSSIPGGPTAEDRMRLLEQAKQQPASSSSSHHPGGPSKEDRMKVLHCLHVLSTVIIDAWIRVSFLSKHSSRPRVHHRTAGQARPQRTAAGSWSRPWLRLQAEHAASLRRRTVSGLHVRP